jgi:hypothetical protein
MPAKIFRRTHICDNVGIAYGVEIMSRLTIDMTDQQHQSLKALAALQGKTIKQYALERLLPTSGGGEQAWSELKDFLNKRIEQGLNGNVKPKSFNQIVDEELSAGEDFGQGTTS